MAGWTLVQVGPLADLGSIPVSPLLLFGRYLEKTIAPPPPIAMAHETAHVKCVAHSAFAKDLFVDMWHLPFQKLILGRPIVVTW